MSAVLSGRDGRLRGGAVGAVALAAATAATWLAWSGWAVLAAEPVRFAPWQLAGTAVSAATLAILAPRWLPAWVVATVMPPSFTAAWSWTAAASDDSGLWAVGGLLVLVGTVLAAAVLVPLGVALRPMRWAWFRGS
ncbi:hypothetical protein [Pseudonocardia xishanensis]|uniref:Uncharacterized protein n=1 Tax=Pseudonocardia xishanensis TaxID=630995 RepID=A0ABP8RM97_9PSEU